MESMKLSIGIKGQVFKIKARLDFFTVEDPENLRDIGIAFR